MIFCFVILHYRTAEDTIECIESIKRLNSVCPVVIVDNASNNGSIEKIEKIYLKETNIYIIKNGTNLGFASGNNVGYQYARNVLHADFIAVSNNDVIIESKNIVEYVVEYYKKNPFHLLGPDIESLVDHGHQNPCTPKFDSATKIKKEINRYKMLLLLSQIGLYDKLKRNKSTSVIKIDNNSWMDRTKNVQLHGSFVIFSPKYIENEECAFKQGTFLYMEEEILYHYCKQKKYDMHYTPEIKVLHKEDSSTNSLFSATKEKREFVFKNMIKSLRVYLNIMQRDR